MWEKMRNLLIQIVTDEPPICHVYFDFFNHLAHASDFVQMLNRDDLKYEYRIDLWFSSVHLRIQSLDFIVNKIKVDCSIALSEQMILRHQFSQTDAMRIFLMISILPSIHIQPPRSMILIIPCFRGEILSFIYRPRQVLPAFLFF